MSLLRKVDSCTPGVMHAWEETFNKFWESSTKNLTNYPKIKEVDMSNSDFSHRGKRRASHHNFLSACATDHELEDQINEWANMTGFLLALGGVALNRKGSAAAQLKVAHMNAVASRVQDDKKPSMMVPMAALQQLQPHGSSQDMYCPVTSYLGRLLRLLVCSNEKFGTTIQKHVKELVGNDMSPQLYPILFDQIKSFCRQVFR